MKSPAIQRFLKPSNSKLELKRKSFGPKQAENSDIVISLKDYAIVIKVERDISRSTFYSEGDKDRQVEKFGVKYCARYEPQQL
jgi:hypothetical protein